MLNHSGLKVLIFFISLVLFVTVVSATEDYAEKTGAECGFCHIDPLGGGELSEAGQGFLLSIGTGSARETGSKNLLLSRLLKLAVGYLHIITAFLWFGTILYVHLVLKPAYASTGLPRGEVKVGLISMVIIGATGSVLTYYRVPSLDLLVSSRFGILLLAKIAIFTVMATSALFVVLVIGPRLKKKKVAKPAEKGDLSRAELASFDGREGQPAYFAYKGKIYDAGTSKLWKNGSHMQRHQAGVDLTELLAQAPHDDEKILALPEIGRLVKKAPSTGSEPHKKVFFFMAYMNCVFQ